MITIPSKLLSATDRQWAAISILCELAGVSFLDFSFLTPTDGFKEFTKCDACDAATAIALEVCRAQNAHGCDIYFRPARYIPAHIIFLDDLTLSAARAAAYGLNHMLVETSPANYQLWLQTDKMLDEVERKAIQTALMRLHGGDKGSTSGEHFGRLPGFKNRKPKHNAPWVNLVQYSLDDAPLAIDTITSQIDMLSEVEVLPPSLPSAGACVLEPAAGGAAGTRVLSDRSESAESHKEWAFACESLKHNVAKQKIIDSIASRALARGKRGTLTGAEKYAKTTVDKAARLLGF